MLTKIRHLLFVLLLLISQSGQAQKSMNSFRVIAFFTGRNDQAHISYVGEAHQWFSKMSREHNFVYDTTSNWNNMNQDFLSKYRVILFLDTRPEVPAQREAFQQYMEHGGAWMGFHFAGFALTPSTYPQNWDWYHNTFLGSGQYKGNTWRPTSAILRVDDSTHPAVKHLPKTFKAAPNEWYKWENDLRQNSNIRILLSIDSTSFPLGTGPKQHEIWHSGYYPVAWSNRDYKMIYVNMGHNDIDYENKTNKTLSWQFENEFNAKFVLDGLLWLGRGKVQ